MTLRKSLLLNLIGFIVLTDSAAAQQSIDDSLSLQSAFAKSLVVYHKALYPSATLYSGIKYSGYPFPFKEGHPFFVTTETDTGSVEKDGVLYHDVRFIYEIVRQIIIVFNPQGDAILINGDRVSAFDLHGYHFIRVSGDSSSVKSGFYALLYNGNVKVLYRPVKLIRSVIDDRKEERFIDEKNYYYLRKGNEYYPVSRKKDVLKVLRDKKPELQQIIRKEHLQFGRREISASLIRVATYYDKLTNAQN